MLDDLYWRDGPIPPDDEWSVKHAGLIASDQWIIDGDHRATAPPRFERADTVVWIDTPLWRRVMQILQRSGTNPAPTRDCLRWTFRYSRHGRRETAAAVAKMNATTVLHRFRTRGAQQRFLDLLSG